MPCNRSDSDVDWHGVYTAYEVWLSEGNISDINALFEIGAGISTIVELLGRWGIIEASTPPGVGILLAGVLVVERGVINFYADGCGVKLTLYVPMGSPVYYQEIHSQHPQSDAEAQA